MNEHTLLVRVTAYVDDATTETLEMMAEQVREVLLGQELDVSFLEAVTRQLTDDAYVAAVSQERES